MVFRSSTTRLASAVLFAGLLFIQSLLAAGAQPDAATGTIDGRVADAASGLSLGNAVVSVTDRNISVVTTANGGFHITGLAPGLYVLRIRRDGYQPADSDTIAVTAGSVVSVTLALDVVPTNQNLTTIGHTSNGAAALQKASTFQETLDAETLLQDGNYRAADPLRQLPLITNGVSGNTAALSDDVTANFLGIGTLEALTTLDGHPVAQGVPGGYNFQLSPLSALKNITVTYGSGSNYSGYSAIGGIVDMQTLDPTPDERFTFDQGYGTWDHAQTSLSATGTIGKLGYALAYGVTTIDGPIRNDDMFQPGAAYDQSTNFIPGASAAVRNLGIYTDDSTAVGRQGLLKLSYALSPITKVTFTGVESDYWENKTGNGDGDYLSYGPALLIGQQQLAAYNPANYPNLPACPSGSFVAFNANGNSTSRLKYPNYPNGFGPTGAPDGGLTCQTPQQYAKFNTGFDGAGPAWQAFNFDDGHLGLESTPKDFDVKLDAFTNRYYDDSDRTDQLPFYEYEGDNLSAKTTDVRETGVTLIGTYLGRNNDIGAGLTYLNTPYAITSYTVIGETLGAPDVVEKGVLFRDTYHPAGSHVVALFTANEKHSTATQDWYLDPRLSVVYTATPHDVVRVAAGATTTNPAANQLDEPFTEASLGGAGGGTPIKCGALNVIGNEPSTALKPERGVDQQVAYGHSFSGDSQIVLTLYNVNVYNKLYSTTVPLSEIGTAGIPSEFLSSVAGQVATFCGVPNGADLLALNGTVNVGQLRAQGFVLSGRQRLDRKTFIDYDFADDSTKLVSVPVAYLQSNPTYIVGAQVPNIPLQTFSASLDHTFPHAIDARYTVYGVGANNPKNLPAYNYSEFRLGGPIAHGFLSATVTNLFNQNAFFEGLRYEGVPLALNQYATASSYGPLGANSTERFGLPYRAIYVNYAFQVR